MRRVPSGPVYGIAVELTPSLNANCGPAQAGGQLQHLADLRRERNCIVVRALLWVGHDVELVCRRFQRFTGIEGIDRMSEMSSDSHHAV